MRLLLLLAILPVPALAWDFRADPVCTLSHQTADAGIVITFDPDLPEYAIEITRTAGAWDESGDFTISFQGGAAAMIGTTRHRLNSDRTTLTVRDRGFGNVLNGIEFNTVMVATSGQTRVSAPTADAGPAVRAFRACPAALPATS